MANDGGVDPLVIHQKPVLDNPCISKLNVPDDGAKGNWLKAALHGDDSATHGIGSRVEIVVGKVKMIREIDGRSSHLSQNSTIAHLGLGSATIVDSVIVTWPGGMEQILINQPVDQLLAITEVTGEKGNENPSWQWLSA